MDIATITPQQFAELCRSGRRLDVIDVRTPAEYAAVHLECARNVPLDRLDPAAVMASRPADAHEPLYVICKSGMRSRQACQQFATAGFSNVRNIEGGTLACLDQGIPVVQGAPALSLERQVRIATGLMILLGCTLAWLVHPGFLGLAAFAGVGLVHAGVTDSCGMGLLLARMPWNQRGPADQSRCRS